MSELLLGDQALDVLRQLFSNEHVALGDLVYQIREREGKGWDGPSVSQWNDAVMNAKKILDREEAARSESLERVKNCGPDLLEALRDMVSDHAELSQATVDNARRVIAKAEGKS